MLKTFWTERSAQPIKVCKRLIVTGSQSSSLSKYVTSAIHLSRPKGSLNVGHAQIEASLSVIGQQIRSRAEMPL